MYSIKLHFRPSVKQGGAEGRLFLRLIYSRQSGNITLPYRIKASEWDPVNHRILLSGYQTDRIRFLLDLQDKITENIEALHLFVSKFERTKEVTAKQIVLSYCNRALEKGLTTFVLALSKKLISESRDRTARAYRTAWRRLIAYSGKPDLTIDDITESFIKGFERLLQSEKCSLNTISFYMRNLRAMYNRGKQSGLFSRNAPHPFRNVYTKIATTRKRALSKNEILKLNCLVNLESQPLAPEEKDALHLFMFSFHACGMSFVDLAYLRKADIKGNILSYYRRKTGRLIQMKISDAMKRSIEYFRDRMKHSPFVFPIIQNHHLTAYTQYCTGLRVQNKRLKFLKDKIGLKKGLSTHMARHSWATIARLESVSVDVISEALGHSFVSTTYIYLDSFGSNIVGKANQKVSKAVGF